MTGIPIKNFGKSYIKPLSKGYRKNNLYYGTIRIEVPKSANKVHMVFGWTRGMLKKTGTDVEMIQQKWQHLTKMKRPINLVPLHNLMVK